MSIFFGELRASMLLDAVWVYLKGNLLCVKYRVDRNLTVLFFKEYMSETMVQIWKPLSELGNWCPVLRTHQYVRRRYYKYRCCEAELSKKNQSWDDYSNLEGSNTIVSVQGFVRNNDNNKEKQRKWHRCLWAIFTNLSTKQQKAKSKSSEATRPTCFIALLLANRANMQQWKQSSLLLLISIKAIKSKNAKQLGSNRQVCFLLLKSNKKQSKILLKSKKKQLSNEAKQWSLKH